MAAKFCRNCGSELVNGMCPKCAAEYEKMRQEEPAGAPSGGSTAVVPELRGQYIRAKGGWRDLLRVTLWILIIAGIGASLLVGVWMVYRIDPGVGFLIMVLGSIITLLLASTTGLKIEMADNIARILEKLNQ